MKNVILISPCFPPSFKYFASALKYAGGNVLAIDDQDYMLLDNVLKDNITEYYRVNSMENYEELYKAVAFFCHKYGRISILDSHNEYWLETEAKLRDDFNIPGLRQDEMKPIKCKSEMKKVYRKAGLKVAEGNVVFCLEDAQKFATKYGYPIIAKPDSGIGAASTYKINNYSELELAFSGISRFPYIVEQFITGSIHSFDGIADEDSEPIFFTSHVFSSGVMEVVNNNQDIYYYSVRELPEELEKAGRKCLKAFNVKNRFFHLEFFYTPSGEYVPLEVNIRPSGGYAVDMYNIASDFDVFKIWADLVINGINKIDYNLKYHVCYIGRKNNICYAHSHDDIMDKLAEVIAMNRTIPVVFRNAMGDYMYLARSESFDVIMDAVEYIQKREDYE